MNRPTKQDCLQHYARYDEPTYFVQLDGFDEGDDVMGMDAEGQAVMGRETYELMSGLYAVRVLMRPGYPLDRIVMLLDKIRALVARGDSLLKPGDVSAPDIDPSLPVRTCQELAADIFQYCCLYGGPGIVSLRGVQDQMSLSWDKLSHERIVTAIEQLERDGMGWCLFNRDGDLIGFQVNECAVEPRYDDDGPPSDDIDVPL